MSKFRMKPMVVEAITFDEITAYWETQVDKNDYSWGFNYNGVPIVREREDYYLIGGVDGFTKNHLLIIENNGAFSVVEKDAFDIISEPIKEREEEEMAKFEKVKRIKEDIKLPERATGSSAGYDFYAIEDTWVFDKDVTYVKTGVKIKLAPDEFLMLCNRSSNPKKKELVLINGVGIVDADYYGNPDNDGEIAFAFRSLNNTGSFIAKGDKIGQGIIMKYNKTEDDNAEGVRTGGFGSTGK